MRILLVALPFALFLPALGHAQALTEAQLLELAAGRGTCGALSPVSASYDPPGGSRVKVTCGEATGFVPALGIAGLGGGAAAAAAGLALVAAASGGDSSPVSTTSAN